MASREHVDLPRLIAMKRAGRKIAMLTAYDYPTARFAEQAGVQILLVGDSVGTVLLGHENTRDVPLDFLLVLCRAVRRGAPGVFLVGDMPFEAARTDSSALSAALRFRDEAGCDAIKIEVERSHRPLVERASRSGVSVIAHLGLRPQQVLTPDGYRAQAREPAEIDALVEDARGMASAGAAMILLEAVPNEAAAAVRAAIDIPLIGCGAGPACDGHVVVTHDMLGIGFGAPPRFVPVFAQMGAAMEDAMRRYVRAVEDGSYPASEHAYRMRSNLSASANT